ncbi:hypothetical protein [Actinoplanes teichomyceticus]|uniref:Uncharacterized protein n=1 Tax=Actinoplanes teichomyceticus TaxID=1867 RepID=A0A561WC41_ACTTI|nr:hypothetical protein [Actinoplanes teichomyceticus]TWG21417.1 hypothetical protein FHX34_103955 [Actinoplanes teichomyceticus]GIF16609.1 hypothetical protein Ate01nite_66410 [Actinoplanes teichomyceticus]
MTAQRVPVQRGALSEPYIMIMKFDPSKAELSKFGDTYADSKFSRAEAEHDARTAADQAALEGIDAQYIVVRAEAVTGFASYQVPGHLSE